LFVKRRSTANPGDIVIAMIEGEATVKRWFPEGDRIRLQPENRTMKPIYIRREDFRQCDLLGTVVGIYRKLT
jgi:repressor LexA